MPKPWILCVLLASCDTKEEAPPPVDDKCPKVDAEKMEGQWIRAQGKQADPRTRFELVKKGDTYEMWYTGGFTKRVLKGERRTADFVFTEVPDARVQGLFNEGDAALLRLYLEPRKQLCALRVTEITLMMKDGKEVEHPKPGFQEFVTFPEGQVMTFRPCDSELFLGDAAKTKKVADQQVEKLGAADPGHQLDEKLPVGTWSRAGDDGSDSCTFDMDLYFDDVPVEGRTKVPAGDVTDGWRHWYVPDWYAPFSGNHHFQAYRYKTCGGQRELVGVACLEAALHP